MLLFVYIQKILYIHPTIPTMIHSYISSQYQFLGLYLTKNVFFDHAPLWDATLYPMIHNTFLSYDI